MKRKRLDILLRAVPRGYGNKTTSEEVLDVALSNGFRFTKSRAGRMLPTSRSGMIRAIGHRLKDLKGVHSEYVLYGRRKLWWRDEGSVLEDRI